MEVTIITNGYCLSSIDINIPSDVRNIKNICPDCKIGYKDNDYTLVSFTRKYNRMYKDAKDQFWANRPGISVIATGVPAIDGTSVPIMAPHFKSGEIDGLNFTSSSQNGIGILINKNRS